MQKSMDIEHLKKQHKKQLEVFKKQVANKQFKEIHNAHYDWYYRKRRKNTLIEIKGKE